MIKKFLIASLYCLPLLADDGTFNLIWDNDAFVDPHKDYHYTNGLELNYITEERVSKGVVENFLAGVPAAENKTNRFKYGLAQQIFTPQNTSTNSIISNDRPYAGWLYFTLGKSSLVDDTLTSFDINLGVIGKPSLAKQAQEGFHNLIGVKSAKGWNNQLKTEPGVVLSYNKIFGSMRKKIL